MEIFLEACNLPRQNHKEIESVNRCITSTETESIINSIATETSPRPDGFTR